MRNDFGRAIIGQRYHRTAFFHQLFRPLRHCGEAVAANVQRFVKRFRRGVDITPHQLFFTGKSNGVDDKVQLTPFGFKFFKQSVHAGFIGDIAWFDEIRADAFGQRRNALQQHFTLIGEGKLRTGIGACLRNTPSDGVFIGDPHYQASFSLHNLLAHNALNSIAVSASPI